MASVGDAEQLIYSLHRRLLSDTSNAAGRHFQGLRQAERHFRKELSAKSSKHMVNIDVAYSLVRHIATASAEECLERITQEIGLADDPDAPSTSFNSNDEQASVPDSDSVAKDVKDCCHSVTKEIIEMEPEEYYGIALSDGHAQTEHCIAEH